MIKKMAILITFIFLALLFLVFHSVRIPSLKIEAELPRNKKIEIIHKWFESLYEEGKFNGVALLAKEGEVIFSTAYGYDGADSSNQLTTHSSFNLASVSKQFTAMGIVLLKDQKKIEYQDKVADHIPELGMYKDISIDHLLHHTSGLPDYMQLEAKNKNKNDLFTTKDMISLYQTHKPELKFKAGTKFQYSNSGYVLLAEIIERVSGTSFQQFMATHVFEPLKMHDSQVYNLLSDKEPEKRVYGFKNKSLFSRKKELRDLNYFDGVAGDGAVYSSAHDLYLWHKALSDGVLVDKDIYEQAYIPAQLSDNSSTRYGFGWVINDDNSVEHAGGWQGFTSYIYRNLDNDDLIVILDNSSNTLRVNAMGFVFNSIGLNLKETMGKL